MEPLSPFANRLNNFLLFGSGGCTFPYISTYFSHYTDGSAADFGLLMLVTAILGMVYSLVACSSADRYRMHRSIYLTSSALSYVSFATLLVIALTGPMKLHTSMGVQGTIELSTVAPPIANVCCTAPVDSRSEVEAELSSQLRYYLICFCIIIASVTQTNCYTLGDAFSADVARKCNQSFASVKGWGTLGWALSSLIISFINDYDELPFLTPAFILFCVLNGSGILLIILWPDERPFDISDDVEQIDQTGFNFAKRFSIVDRTVDGLRKDLVSVTEETGDKFKIKMTRASITGFDSIDHDPNRNIKLYSEKPLGDNHIIKLFKLNSGNNCYSHVTKIEPMPDKLCDKAALQAFHVEICDNKPKTKEKKTRGLMLSFLIVFMIIKRNKLVARHMILLAIVGFLISMNWYYLFPYLDFIDEVKFKSLSPNIMIVTYVSELAFYSFSSVFLKSFRYSTGLALIMVIFGIRYALYVPLGLYNDRLTLDYFMLVEIFHAVNTGWFDCIFNESAMEYANEARDCVPDLISQGYIEATKEDIAAASNGVKGTMVALSSCFYEGIGLALGSATGGFLIDSIGYFHFWVVVACIGFFSGFVNLLIDLNFQSKRAHLDDNGEDSPTQNKTHHFVLGSKSHIV